MSLKRTMQAGVGLWPSEYTGIPMFIRGGTGLRGDVLMQDHRATVAETTTAGASSLGASTSIWSNMITPTAGGILAGGTAGGVNVQNAGPAFGVLQAAGADDDQVLCTFQGFVTAFVICATSNVEIGNGLVVDTSRNLDAIGAVGERIIAMAQANMTTPSTRTLAEVYINGIGWLGCGVLVGS